MTTEISKDSKNLSVLFPDVLKRIWKDDLERDWKLFFKEQQFSYFWDTRKEAQK